MAALEMTTTRAMESQGTLPGGAGSSALKSLSSGLLTVGMRIGGSTLIPSLLSADRSASSVPTSTDYRFSVDTPFSVLLILHECAYVHICASHTLGTVWSPENSHAT